MELGYQLTILMNVVGDTIFAAMFKMQLGKVDLAVLSLHPLFKLRILFQEVFHLIAVANSLMLVFSTFGHLRLELPQILLDFIVSVPTRLSRA